MVYRGTISLKLIVRSCLALVVKLLLFDWIKPRKSDELPMKIHVMKQSKLFQSISFRLNISNGSDNVKNRFYYKNKKKLRMQQTKIGANPISEIQE